MPSRTAFSDPGSETMIFPLARTRAGAAHHGCGADFLIAQHAEELAEAFQPFFDEPRYDFVGGVARRNPRASGRDNHLRIRGIELSLQRCFDRRGIVANDPASGQCVAAGFEQLRDGRPARVGARLPRVADGQHVTAHGARRRRLVIDVAHVPYVRLKGQFVARP